MTLSDGWRGWTQREKDWALGLSFITTVAVIWVLASFLVQDIEAEGLDPFLLTYIANSLFVVLLPIHYLSQHWQQQRFHANYSKSRCEQLPLSMNPICSLAPSCYPVAEIQVLVSMRMHHAAASLMCIPCKMP